MMSIPHVPTSLTCANCGEKSPVVTSLGRQGEQLVIARMEGKYYVTILCPFCGKVQQEIDYPPAEK
jgi:transcription elongation factor Elf1